MRGPIEEGLYEVDTINLLYYNNYPRDKVLDRIDVIIKWLDGFSRRQLNIYRDPVGRMLTTIKHIIKEVDSEARSQ